MRAIVQRVTSSRVEVSGETVGEIGEGVLIFLGVGGQDTEKDCEQLVNKICHLRIFPDDGAHLNRSLLDVRGAALVVSQFTLWGDCRKGRRPSFSRAAPPERARMLYETFVRMLRDKVPQVATGVFQEMMSVYLVNDGPVTLMLDSEKQF
jgi:D-tyrosyl-tRNA(Tyr) deacylase